MLPSIKNLFTGFGRVRCEAVEEEVPSVPSKFHTISIMGQQTKFFGHLGDQYYDNLAAHAAQNSSYIAELLKLSPNATVIDVGANIGVTTVAAARCVPEGRVVSIEPSPKAFGYLEKCISANALNNVTLLNAGAGEAAGEISFVESEFLAGSYVALDAREQSTSRVQILTLDAIAKNHELHDIRLIKIDVEGFELDVLLGATEIIDRFRPRFVMEFNSFALTANRNLSPRSLLDFILDKFGKFEVNRDGIMSSVSSATEVRDFIYSNMAARGCVDDIMFGGSSEA